MNHRELAGMKNAVKVFSLSLLLAAPVTFTSPVRAQVVPTDQTAQVWKQASSHFPALQMAEYLCRPQGSVALEPNALVADSSNDQEWSAYSNSGYDYWDAKVLANFWGQDVSQAKARIGRKVLWGGENKAHLAQMLLDARIKALGQVENLNFYAESGFSYDDVQKLSKFWGGNAWETKIRIERNLVMGDSHLVFRALEYAKKR